MFQWIYLFLLPPLLYAQFRNYHLLEIIIASKDNCVMLCNGSLDCTTQVLCENWQHFDLRLPEHTKKKNMLLVAHNGLRNRLASKLNMGDMLMMEWDDPLTELANRYHVHCLIHRVDDCGNETVIDEGTIYKMQHERVYGGRRKDIARNTFFLPINQIHSNFIELALVNWYFDHQKLPRPKLTNYETFKYYELIGDNNFTHMMCPQTYRIGCSYAKFLSGISLCCYYFPFIHSDNRTAYFMLREKDYQCPYLFPIFDAEFSELCKYADYSVSRGSKGLQMPLLFVINALFELLYLS